jgi:regulatory protein
VLGDDSSSPSDNRRDGASDPASGAELPPDGGADNRTVVSIELKGAAGEVVRIHLSDGSFFILHAEVFAREGIVAGTRLDPERVSRLLVHSERVLARLRALALLSRAAHTAQGLARKLRTRGFSADAIRHSLLRMRELGYLDDRAFAEAWVTSRMSLKKEGVKALSRGLLRRGVARALAEEVVAAACTFTEELECARLLCEGLSPRSAIRMLTQRGFRSRTIAAVLSEIRGKRREEPEG